MSLVPVLSSRSLKSFVLCAAILAGGCDRQSGAESQPQASQGASEALPGALGAEVITGGLDRSYKGAAIPAVTAKDGKGNALDLASLKGKPFLLNLWATWCAPCIAELPTLDALHKGGTLRVVAVSQDLSAPEKVAPFLKSHDAPNLEPWIEQAADLSFAYGGNLPITVLFGSDGKEVWRWTGGNEWDSPEAMKLLAEAK